MYNIGGCMINPMSCNSGLRSLPFSGGNGNVRSKGLDVSNINRPKPTAIIASTDSARALNTSGRDRLKIATAAPQVANTSAQSNNEPSWADQTALNLKYIGKERFELSTTYRRLKSSSINAVTKHPKAILTKTKCPIASECANRIHRCIPR